MVAVIREWSPLLYRRWANCFHLQQAWHVILAVRALVEAFRPSIIITEQHIAHFIFDVHVRARPVSFVREAEYGRDGSTDDLRLLLILSVSAPWILLQVLIIRFFVSVLAFLFVCLWLPFGLLLPVDEFGDRLWFVFAECVVELLFWVYLFLDLVLLWCVLFIKCLMVLGLVQVLERGVLFPFLLGCCWFFVIILLQYLLKFLLFVYLVLHNLLLCILLAIVANHCLWFTILLDLLSVFDIF